MVAKKKTPGDRSAASRKGHVTRKKNRTKRNAAQRDEQQATRTDPYNANERTLSHRDMPVSEQLANEQTASETRTNLRSRLEMAGKPSSNDTETIVGKKSRYRKVAADPRLDTSPRSLDEMTAQLVDTFTRGTHHSRRLPGESVAGGSFFFKRHQDFLERTEGATQFTPEERVQGAATTGAYMSNNVKPEMEADTATALVNAHSGGVVHFTPDLLHALGHTPNSPDSPDALRVGQAKTRTPKVHVPEHLYGKQVNFADLPAATAEGIRGFEFSDAVDRNSRGVNWGGLRTVGRKSLFINAHQAMQGTQSLSPHDDPKRFNYMRATVEAAPNQSLEYSIRAKDVSDHLQGTGDQDQDQMSFHDLTHDFTGHERSSAGALNPAGPVPMDTWMRRAAGGQHPDVAGAVADVYNTAKAPKAKVSVPTDNPNVFDEQEVMVGRRDTRVGALSAEHALHQEALHRATAQITTHTGIAVPSSTVQEVIWATRRREGGADAEFNRHQASLPESGRMAQGDHLSTSMNNYLTNNPSPEESTKPTQVTHQQRLF